VLGEGADILIIDDPHSGEAVHSERQRAQVHQWFDHSWMTRLNHKSEGLSLVVMQRLHPDDLCGYILRKSGQSDERSTKSGVGSWWTLRFPMVASGEESMRLGRLCLERPAGHLLHGGRDGPAVVEALKEDLGRRYFSAQYLQAPLSASEDGVSRDWFPLCPWPVSDGSVVECWQSWDTAYGVGPGSDYSVGLTVALLADGRAVIVDVQRGQWSFPDLESAVLETARQWSPKRIIIENHASGLALIPSLRKKTPYRIDGVTHRLGKLWRYTAVRHWLEQRVVGLRSAAWNQAYLEEWAAFPHGRYDDQVDATTQWLYRWKMAPSSGPSIRLGDRGVGDDNQGVGR
jgi:predicted phage terminase large subunit-like protein